MDRGRTRILSRMSQTASDSSSSDPALHNLFHTIPLSRLNLGFTLLILAWPNALALSHSAIIRNGPCQIR